MARRLRWPAVALIVAVLSGLAIAAFVVFEMRREPAPEFFLRRVAFDSLAGWSGSDEREAIEAFSRSCQQLEKLPADQPLSGRGYGGAAGDWRSVCHAVPRTPSEALARKWFVTHFVPFEIETAGSREALFTGYYEPELHVSRVPNARFKFPVYGVPDDLIQADLGEFRASLAGEHIAGRLEANRLVPYATRAEIDRFGASHARILFYADDPVGLFFLHIQGSGRALLPEGEMVRVAYAAQNGRPYTPIGRVLVASGALERGKVSMQAIRTWMMSHPADATRLMEKDQSFVFFKELPLGDPRLGSAGAEGVPLTPDASLAVDLRFHPLSAPFYVVTTIPDPVTPGSEHPLRSLFVAQDIGGAIRGPARADLFFGYGKAAEYIAGKTKAVGQLYVLLPTALAARIGGGNV